MKSINPSGSRVELAANDSLREVLELRASPTLRVLQFSKPLAPKFLDALNNEFFTVRPDVQLRAYGFYGEICDLSFCSRMWNVESFAADCLRDAEGIENIGQLPRLKFLSVGIWHLDSFAFLTELNRDLSEIFLGATNSKKPDIAPLSRFQSLRKLYLESQQKNIEVIAGHGSLEELIFRSITLESLAFVRTLSKLWSLDLKLGGTRDLSAIDGLDNLKYLELWQILGLKNIDAIASLRGLQSILLQSLPHISSLPSLADLTKLRRVCLDNMKGLTDISGLEKAPALEELLHFSSQALPEEYVPLLKRQTLKMARVGFGSSKKNARFEQLCLENHITTGINSNFEFR